MVSFLQVYILINTNVACNIFNVRQVLLYILKNESHGEAKVKVFWSEGVKYAVHRVQGIEHRHGSSFNFLHSTPGVCIALSMRSANNILGSTNTSQCC